ncbi:translation initiation factor IF-2-like [Elephas maximus indicus]|uniref:translation initiation factor IF-2-like n=1 Tax=Elephas maximus indicus TaxID=99487 RepID=UPI002116E406|nr:translation initiation factor IF-2-like [Elephas maximus indicus]XP_049709346.1 translation initiation factor IF-2-like [Elephas maximus indicus]XP_049709347.1 translation initiation factor IF-2-like [Elephas maximus indicus]XP_049709348.1 translation initiation factor IF-2-like [Elephas maximus indicus]XP_049709349.1 translation initiation factor IF-2-like [Elephas maximus indicus]
MVLTFSIITFHKFDSYLFCLEWFTSIVTIYVPDERRRRHSWREADSMCAGKVCADMMRPWRPGWTLQTQDSPLAALQAPRPEGTPQLDPAAGPPPPRRKSTGMQIRRPAASPGPEAPSRSPYSGCVRPAPRRVRPGDHSGRGTPEGATQAANPTSGLSNLWSPRDAGTGTRPPGAFPPHLRGAGLVQSGSRSLQPGVGVSYLSENTAGKAA